MDLPSLRLFLGAGALVGGMLYAIVRLKKGKKVDVAAMLEAALVFAGIPGGVHLALSALFPNHLVHLVDPDGVLPVGHRVHVELGEWHTVEIAAGGAAIAVLMIHLFCRLCSK